MGLNLILISICPAPKGTKAVFLDRDEKLLTFEPVCMFGLGKGDVNAGADAEFRAIVPLVLFDGMLSDATEFDSFCGIWLPGDDLSAVNGDLPGADHEVFREALAKVTEYQLRAMSL